MPRMSTSTRTLSEAERREQILAAARAVFDEKGSEPATVSEVATVRTSPRAPSPATQMPNRG